MHQLSALAYQNRPLSYETPCMYISSPPNGCLQYHTGIDGRFTTFNYDNPTTAQQTHLRNQNYRICIRQEEGT